MIDIFDITLIYWALHINVMSRKDPVIITMDMIHMPDDDYPYATCKSASDPSVTYTVNYLDRTCNCNGFTYCKKIPKICKHVESVLRFRAIKQAQQA